MRNAAATSSARRVERHRGIARESLISLKLLFSAPLVSSKTRSPAVNRCTSDIHTPLFLLYDETLSGSPGKVALLCTGVPGGSP